jgi:hypothetical protein
MPPSKVNSPISNLKCSASLHAKLLEALEEFAAAATIGDPAHQHSRY